MTGRLIGVVGPSGVGKDTLMTGLRQACPAFQLVRRVITRDASLGGEDFDAVSEATFARMVAEGAFCVHWDAHGLRYGIPDEVHLRIAEGEEMLVNLSRDVLSQFAAVFPTFEVLSVTARPETLAARIQGRGRETQDEIARRLARPAKPFFDGLSVHEIDNDGALENAVAAALSVLQPERV